MKEYVKMDTMDINVSGLLWFIILHRVIVILLFPNFTNQLAGITDNLNLGLVQKPSLG